MFENSRHSRSLLKIIQKYLQACQTFWSFYNFRKMFGTSRHSRSSYKNIYKLARHSEASTTSGKMSQTSRHSRSLLKIIQKYLQACQHCEASTTSEKCLGPPGTPGVHIKLFTSLLDILKPLHLQKNIWDLKALQEFI